jgi:HlyD family secretion protein
MMTPLRSLRRGRGAATAARFLLLLLLVVIGCGERGGRNPSGTLEATEIDVSPLLSGKVLSVGAELGDRVARNDTLLVLDTELLELQRAQTEANRRALEAERNVAREALRQARRSLQLAEKTLARTQALLAGGTATAQQVDELETRRDVAASQAAAAESRLDLLEAKEEKLLAALALFDRQIRDGVLLSPIDGTVLVRSVEPGEIAGQGMTVMRLADLSAMELRVYLETENLDLLRIGETVPVLVDALDEELSGRVTWISSEAEFTPKNAQTRKARAQLVYAVKIRVENEEGRLHIGMPAEVRLPSRS